MCHIYILFCLVPFCSVLFSVFVPLLDYHDSVGNSPWTPQSFSPVSSPTRSFVPLPLSYPLSPPFRTPSPVYMHVDEMNVADFPLENLTEFIDTESGSYLCE